MCMHVCILRIYQFVVPSHLCRDYFYGLAEKGDSGGLLTPPCVGDFCCAQFTEDGCWYRAKVEAVEQLFTTTEGTYCQYSFLFDDHTCVGKAHMTIISSAREATVTTHAWTKLHAQIISWVSGVYGAVYSQCLSEAPQPQQ